MKNIRDKISNLSDSAFCIYHNFYLAPTEVENEICQKIDYIDFNLSDIIFFDLDLYVIKNKIERQE
jgi:hypothetical protein